MKRMNSSLVAVLGCLCLLGGDAAAFCGFYVSRADSELYNESSQVALVRKGKRTVITMANDYKGPMNEFAIVIPVPTVINKKDVRVVEKELLDHLDRYSAPRLVEYWDDDPCNVYTTKEVITSPPSSRFSLFKKKQDRLSGAKALGVTIEREFSAGEYDILVLSAKESDGLVTWLNQNEYRIPDGAEEVLTSYIRQDVKFFVAKVNLKKQARSGRTWLRPIQVEFTSRKFMLPIRLGTVNANGPQDLLVFCLSSKGRVETTNYRNVKIPSNEVVSEFVKIKFPQFYRDMFAQSVKNEGMKTVFTEYAWDMGWCDPCADEPFTNGELSELGVNWAGGKPSESPQEGKVILTRLHVRYDAKSFPEDLMFQETGDKTNFQGRYILQHPFTGEITCDAGRQYLSELPKKKEERARTLNKLTGWSLSSIRGQAAQYVEPPRNQ